MRGEIEKGGSSCRAKPEQDGRKIIKKIRRIPPSFHNCVKNKKRKDHSGVVPNSCKQQADDLSFPGGAKA